MGAPSRRQAIGCGVMLWAVCGVATGCAPVFGSKLQKAELAPLPDAARAGLPSEAPPKPVPLVFTAPGTPRGAVRSLAQEAERRRLAPDEANARAQTARDEARKRQVAIVQKTVTPFGELHYLRSRRIPASYCRNQNLTGEAVVHTFFSYTKNVAVYVRMCGENVVATQARAGARPAASPKEQADAIKLAQQDPRLKDQVADLRAQAIVTGTCRGHVLATSCSHRTLFVAFTKLGEEAPRYQAEVDLVDGRVLTAGPSAPASAVRPNAQPTQPATVNEGQEVWSGDVAWKGWKFHYEMEEGAQAGLVIENVEYQGQKFIRKMSLPVIRVKYRNDSVLYMPWTWRIFDRGCGPFMDQIDREAVHTIQQPVPIPGAGDHPGPCPHAICYREWTDGDIAWLEVGVYARIGQYHIYQAWYFSGPAHDRGPRPPAQIAPVIWSGGVACDMVHTHHPYWRFHFDIDGQGKDQVLVLRENTWTLYKGEGDDVKETAPKAAMWLVRRPDSRRGVWIVPGESDGMPDRFSNHDLSVRLYHDYEDADWEFDFYEDLGYLDEKEAVDRQSNVVWYVGHARHEPQGEARNRWQWHRVGPYLVLQPAR